MKKVLVFIALIIVVSVIACMFLFEMGVSQSLDTPDIIYIYKNGQQITINKENTLFNQIVTATNKRISGYLEYYKVVLDDGADNNIKNEHIVVEYVYSTTIKKDFKIKQEGNIRKEYTRLFMPITGNETDTIYLSNGTSVLPGVLGGLMPPDELISLIDKV
ncbi:MAG: hypothetical protein BWY74_03138 [Firmicutes bacterium ADurb.Bin419]|nr:MAG: hypothetical protein BWY74_03138 [Firmicutes bacterium ADurb.Bin419]